MTAERRAKLSTEMVRGPGATGHSPCPFCGSIELFAESDFDLGKWGSCIVCDGCATRGPDTRFVHALRIDAEAAAWLLWDRREFILPWTRKPRLMSFQLTTQQIVDRTKDVTRRLDWQYLDAGDLLWACEKVRCVPVLQRRVLALIQVVRVHREPLTSIDQAEVAREGFPGMSPAEFVEMFRRRMACLPDMPVTRVEFRYLAGPNGK